MKIARYPIKEKPVFCWDGARELLPDGSVVKWVPTPEERTIWERELSGPITTDTFTTTPEQLAELKRLNRITYTEAE